MGGATKSYCKVHGHPEGREIGTSFVTGLLCRPSINMRECTKVKELIYKQLSNDDVFGAFISFKF